MKSMALIFAMLMAISSPIAGQDAVERIRSLRAESNAAIARHDATGVISQYDADYQGTGGLGGNVQMAAMPELWAMEFGTADDLVYVRTPELIEVSSSGARAVEIGTWSGSWTTEDGVQNTGGRYAAHWVLVEADWKIRSELFVSLR